MLNWNRNNKHIISMAEDFLKMFLSITKSNFTDKKRFINYLTTLNSG